MLAETTLPTQTYIPPVQLLDAILHISADLHRHLCPRQVLGARIGLAGARALGLLRGDEYEPYANPRKRLLVVAETDGCGVDGISAAVNAWVGRRTLRIADYGKMGATFVDTHTEQAVRVGTRPQSRELAPKYAPHAKSRWHSYLEAYRIIPEADLLTVRPVRLRRSVAEIVSRPKARAYCADCGEEIMNEREITADDGRTLCQACAGNAYYFAA